MNQPYLHAAATTLDAGPKETLYVSGLNDKIKIEDMKFILHTLFSQYGEILQITMKKTNKLRGQAFIVFQNITSATNAKAALTGMLIFHHPLVLEYLIQRVEFAKQRSEIFDRMEGKIYYKKKQPKELQPSIPSDLQQKVIPVQQPQESDANNVLICESLPDFMTEAVLQQLFEQYPGYKTLKYIAPRHLALVEFGEEEQASVALRGLNGFRLTAEIQLRVKYARKD